MTPLRAGRRMPSAASSHNAAPRHTKHSTRTTRQQCLHRPHTLSKHWTPARSATARRIPTVTPLHSTALASTGAHGIRHTRLGTCCLVSKRPPTSPTSSQVHLRSGQAGGACLRPRRVAKQRPATQSTPQGPRDETVSATTSHPEQTLDTSTQCNSTSDPLRSCVSLPHARHVHAQ